MFDIGAWRLLFLSSFHFRESRYNDIKKESGDDKGYIERKRDVYSIPLFFREIYISFLYLLSIYH